MATLPLNYSHQLVKLLIDFGAHLDEPNDTGMSPLDAIRDYSDICVINYITLKCLCATQIVKRNISYVGQIPKTLENFVRMHEP